MKKGFTFIEIMVVLALVGVLATAAVGPMVHLVGLLQDSKVRLGDKAALDDAFSLMFRDMRCLLPVGEKNLAYAVLKRRDIFGGNWDDLLLIASGSLLDTSLIPGTVAYGLVRQETFSSESLMPGLYRWVFPGKAPQELDLQENFPVGKGALVVPYVDSFRVEFYKDQSWVGDYSGPMPRAMKIALKRKGETYEAEDWFPFI